MEASSGMFIEQSLKFSVLGVEQGGTGQRQVSPPWVCSVRDCEEVFSDFSA